MLRGIGEAGLVETRTPVECKQAIGGMLEELNSGSIRVDAGAAGGSVFRISLARQQACAERNSSAPSAAL